MQRFRIEVVVPPSLLRFVGALRELRRLLLAAGPLNYDNGDGSMAPLAFADSFLRRIRR
jgi:hypothetical protein